MTWERAEQVLLAAIPKDWSVECHRMTAISFEKQYEQNRAEIVCSSFVIIAKLHATIFKQIEVRGGGFEEAVNALIDVWKQWRQKKESLSKPFTRAESEAESPF